MFNTQKQFWVVFLNNFIDRFSFRIWFTYNVLV